MTWDFPGLAATAPLHDFNDSFMESLSEFLEQASSEAFDQFAARAHKSGHSIVETRDCANSALISKMLMSLLQGIGGPFKIRKIRKRVRDDVVLAKSEIPWRRSPYWLVLRVAIRRLLSTIFNDSQEGVGRIYFKFIICMMLANLLKDCVGSLLPEKTLFLQAKLCRRLAKLDTERLAASGELRSAYEDFFFATSRVFKSIATEARLQVTAAWNGYKRDIVRQIPTLPSRASPKDRILSLHNSRSIFQRLLSQKTSPPSRKVSFALPSFGEGVSQVHRLAADYTALVDYETGMRTKTRVSLDSPESRCVSFAKDIWEYLSKAQNAYNNDPLLMSRYLLGLFELWVNMDQAATIACPPY